MDDIGRVNQKRNPQQNANIFSRIFFCFFNRFMWKGFQREIQIEDVYVHLKEDECRLLTNELSNGWDKHVSKAQRPSLGKTIATVYYSKFLLCGILLLIEECFHFLQPILVGIVMGYFRFDSIMTQNEALMYGAALVSCVAVYPIVHHPYMYTMYRLCMKMRVAATGLIFNKSLRLSMNALHKTTVGKVLNLVSNDVERFDKCCIFVHYLWAAPLIFLGYSVLLWRNLGPSMFAGYLVMFIILPLNVFFAKKLGNYRKKIAVKTDKRVGIMSEILHGIRLIKMYTWEDPFSDMVHHIRSAEVKSIRGSALWQCMSEAWFFLGSPLVMLCAFTAYIYSGHDLTAEKVFVSAMLFNGCRFPLMVVFYTIASMFQLRVSVHRIQDFLLLDEHVAVESPMSKQINADHTEPLLQVTNLTAKWDDAQESPTIKDFSFCVKPGQLAVVIGPVGCGKSTLLNTILGETQSTEGQLVCRGSIAYVPQDAWVFTATLRQNVIFGTDYVPRKYQTAIEVCALKKDLRVLPNGDLSLVGDRGITLSGGQKARVNLARAVYRDADIYLFDDPLSAVDAAVGRYMFEKCIKKHLSDKIRVLVTHQLQYLQQADVIIVVKDGKMVSSGTYDELLEMGEEFTEILRQTEQSYSRQESIPKTPEAEELVSSPLKSSAILSAARRRRGSRHRSSDSAEHEKLMPNENTGNQLMVMAQSLTESAWSLALGQAEKVSDMEEEKESGAVEFNVYFKYLRGMSNAFGIFAIFFVFVLAQVVFNLSDWWLNLWATESERQIFIRNTNFSLLNTSSMPPPTFVSNLDTDTFHRIYIGLVVLVFVLGLTKAIAFRLGMLNSSRKLHNRMFHSVLRTAVSFFDSNPQGRILNRFTKDMNSVDERLPQTLNEFFGGALIFGSLVLVVCLLNPYVFLPTTPLMCVFIFSRYYYLHAARDVKRLEATSRSPLYGHVSSSLDGLACIRAFKTQNAVINNFYNYQNVHTSTYHAWLTASRWYAVVIDWMVVVFVAFVVFVSIFTATAGSNVGDIGQMLMYSLTLTHAFSFIMRQSAEVENGMVSVERILEYGSLEPEEPQSPLDSEPNKQPPKDWPKEGAIEMQNVCMKYESSNAQVLSDLNFVVQPKQKIGIVGRTGAGKSSLLKVLFRLVQFEGTVKIDAIDCKTIGLHDLRKRISIIPQDPVIFIGSLRKNLDPFGEFSEEALWKALEQVELKSSVSEMDQGLDTSMAEGGVNLSVGQRQLLCLARAILKHSQILVIDEATANVDLQTDALIQKTLRERFCNSTVLTIAHRLNTIMDSDKIMVLDNGHLTEFDHAHKLLQNDGSIFTSLVNETGEQNAHVLRTLARQAYSNSK